MTVFQWLTAASARLSMAGIESAKLESQLLAAHTLGKSRTWVIAHPEAEIPELAAEALLQRREQREPLAYILGYREFYGRRFEVEPGVLIPRQETEILLEAALGLADGRPILDLGTGSGCLAVSLKLERPGLEVWASDVSPKALSVAARNAENLEADIHIIESDLFAKLPTAKFGLIVSNPPYIGNDEPLMPEVVGHEPAMALFSGPTGLEFYERLAVEAVDYLLPSGRLALEVGYLQAHAVVEILKMNGWENISTTPDLSGIERVVVSTRSAQTTLP